MNSSASSYVRDATLTLHVSASHLTDFAGYSLWTYWTSPVIRCRHTGFHSPSSQASFSVIFTLFSTSNTTIKLHLKVLVSNLHLRSFAPHHSCHLRQILSILLIDMTLWSRCAELQKHRNRTGVLDITWVVLTPRLGTTVTATSTHVISYPVTTTQLSFYIVTSTLISTYQTTATFTIVQLTTVISSYPITYTTTQAVRKPVSIH